jgi:hypothetical protein
VPEVNQPQLGRNEENAASEGGSSYEEEGVAFGDGKDQ